MAEPTKTVKCLVWDLDNTLWQGVLLEGDDVQLSEETRTLLSTLDARGILQSVCSKNDFADAWERLEKLGVAEYFVHPAIGWGPKSAAVRDIAERLQFAEDTIAFVDDQPAERAEVEFHLPKVRCYAAEQLPELAGLPEFSPAVVTQDSRRRREMYQAGLRRDAERETFAGPDERFLRSLELVATIAPAGDEELLRVEELTLRTSQMNATGVHYSHEMLASLVKDPRHRVLTVTMSDRFGPYGAVGVMLLELHEHVWNLKLLATSCRVVSLGAGTLILNWIADQAARADAHLAADFRRNERNRMMEVAYRFAGYTTDTCDCLGILPPPDPSDVERLHLVPVMHDASSTVRLNAPDLRGMHGQPA
ncbi:MAG: HAD-IIIC family phosphatase [Hamadaea sp.]|nr:HAD-IIIC family phosphatase [Hamadaea sp.]NUT22017.1 HAD-IIIC family phosphatase [Hamadaea sp.]